MISSMKMTKIRSYIQSTIAATASYDLNGATMPADVTVSLKENTVRILLTIDASASGQVSNIQVFDSDGDLSCSSETTFNKPVGKKMYVAFAVTVSEEVI